MTKIKALQSFAHKSGKSFIIGREYEVQDASALEFVAAHLAVIVDAPAPKNAKHAEHKYVDVTPPVEVPATDREVY
jgi:hypothetical protein